MAAPAKCSGPELSGSAKLDEVTRLMGLLELDLKEKNLLPPIRNKTLELLKQYTRNKDNAGPLFTKEGIKTLCGHCFDGNSLTTAREALRCLQNVMLLEPKTRQIFVDLGYPSKAAERMKSDNRDDEFLASRLLFLLTYDSNLNFDDLFDNNQLAESINTNLYRQAKTHTKSTTKHPVTSLDTMALSETLKLLFNMTQFYPHQVPVLSKSLRNILKILSRVQIPTPPLQPPVNWIINGLLNLDLEDKKANHFSQNPLFPKFDAKCNADRLINILDAAVRQYKDEELEKNATPLVILLRQIYDFAPDAVKGYMRWLLLPSNDERAKPLGKSDTLSAFLLRLSTSPAAPNLRESISSMMFELSDRDATSFVRNVGYGFASGFLMTHDMPVPENAMEAWSTNGNETKKESEAEDPGGKVTSVDGVEINPVTGQRRDMEPVDLGPEMSQEEKEREAEKLFVLFERLKATGVVNVMNPVEQAMQEGRFEEIE